MQQSYKLDAETSLSSKGLFGFGLTLGYQHKNIFGGAEILDISVSSAFQKLRLSAEMPIQNSIELGSAATLTFPSFLLPVSEKIYRSVRNARTELGVSYTFQNRPDYRRNIVNLNWGYAWSCSRFFNYSINPISLNVVNLSNRNSAFFDQITDPYLKSSYEDHFNFGSYHSILLTNRISYKQSYFALRGNLELNGNLLRMISQAFMKPSGQNEAGRDVYKICDIPYSQYSKFDLDLSYLWVIDEKNALAFRGFAGLGVPYGNSYSLPIERMYYSGGPSSMRGWQIRSLGPGSYVPDSIGDVMYQVSDMKLEFNAEYRFKLIKYLEGAVFMDMGNIWTINKNDPRVGALFDWKRFYNEVAMNTGIGARLNLDFLIIRVDWGLQLKQPGQSLKDAWVSPRDWIEGGASSWHFAIGYPF
jgi:outer membrane protein assembly factor BamA